MNRRVLEVYRRVMSLPEGLTYREQQKDVRHFVHSLPMEVRQGILDRAEEIEEASWDRFFANQKIFAELGFTQTECEFFARCRLNSPGIRTLIKERVAITKYATPEEILAINNGAKDILNDLKLRYVKESQ